MSRDEYLRVRDVSDSECWLQGHHAPYTRRHGLGWCIVAVLSLGVVGALLVLLSIATKGLG